MTETTEPYRVNSQSPPIANIEAIANEFLSDESLAKVRTNRILRSDYFYHVRFTVNALLIRGEQFEDYDELIDSAIVLTDRLVERVEEKI